MRDIKLFVDEDSNLVDVDVVNGEPVLLDFAEQTGDQRALKSSNPSSSEVICNI